MIKNMNCQVFPDFFFKVYVFWELNVGLLYVSASHRLQKDMT